MSKEVLYTLCTGDVLYRQDEAVVAEFHGRRHVLSTGSPNGGYTDYLTHVYNHKSGYNHCMDPENAPCSFEEYRENLVERQLGLSLKTVSGMATIVSMKNICIETRQYRDLIVTAAATASLEVNGGRPGDPAEYYEEPDLKKPGTINIMLFTNVDMTPACMARSIVTLTEAKTSAIQELMGSSLYSSGLATGSGSDTVMIIADAQSPTCLHYAGKHGKLGELTGLAVREAVRRALGRHMGLTPQSQHSMEKRTFRYGLTVEKYAELYTEREGAPSREAFTENLRKMDRDEDLVTLTSLYVHLMDQLSWKLLSEEEAIRAGRLLLERMAARCHVENTALPELPPFEGPAGGMAAGYAALMLLLGERGTL